MVAELTKTSEWHFSLDKHKSSHSAFMSGSHERNNAQVKEKKKAALGDNGFLPYLAARNN